MVHIGARSPRLWLLRKQLLMAVLAAGLLLVPQAATAQSGNDLPSPTPSWTQQGEAGGDTLGYALAPAGDVNGDGYDDIVAGALGNNNDVGKAYLYLGGASGVSTTPNWTAVGEASSNVFGASVAGAGDVNKDGYDDVVVGAPGYDNTTGKVYLYYGSAAGLSTTANWTATGGAASGNFGDATASAGDVNGDGYGDIVIGAFRDNAYTGKAYVYLGGATGLSATPAWTAVGEVSQADFGASVASAGDVNKDGYSDVVVSAPGQNRDITGKAYLYLGSAAGVNATPSWTVADEAYGDALGRSVAGAGDVNKDGYDDVVVGAPVNNLGAGKAYVYLGGAAGLSSTASWSAVGEAAPANFGQSVTGAGDVNGDGYGDIVVSAYRNNSQTGKIYLYLGSATGPAVTAAWTAVGEAANNFFGNVVAGAGDVNKDGYDDIAASATGYNSYTGKVYAFYKGPADTTAPVVSITGQPGNPSNDSTPTFTFSAADNTGGSGVASYKCSVDGSSPAACTSPITSGTLAGGSHTFAVTATDKAGNTSSPASYTWLVDTLAPTATATRNPGPNGFGWNNTNVTVNWTWTDNAGGAGINSSNCGTSVTLPGPGVSTSTATCSDLAGNVAVSAGVTVKIDKTAPAAAPTRSPAANGAGWNNTDVTATWNWSDSNGGAQAAGIDSTQCPAASVSSGDGAALLIAATCADQAGNVSAPASVTANVDKTAPTNVAGAPAAPANGANGWYKSPVTVQFTGNGDVSGIASCTTTTYGGPDSAAATVSGSCTDNAGNTSATATSSAFKYDATTPVLVPSVSPNPASLNLAATATANASDATSGVASQGCATPDTSSTGSKSVTCSAVDNAGNAATAAADYTVINNPPTLVAAPGGACLSDGGAKGTINLAVDDINTGAGGLTLSLVSNSNTSLVPNANVTFGGSGAGRTLTVTAATKKTGKAVLTIGVSDGFNRTPLTVNVFVGSDKNETLNGTADTDMLFGLLGTNIINGFGSNDLLCGGNSVDTLNGGDGDDMLGGNRGNDVLNGQNGSDTLTGGQGGDRFSGGPDIDSATDFTPSQGDTNDGTTELVTVLAAGVAEGEITNRVFLPAVQH